MLTTIFIISLICGFQGTFGQECEKTGVQCTADKCKVVLCAIVGENPVQLNDCGATQNHCQYNESSFAAECVPGNCNGPSHSHPITCAAPGIFPSPYECDLAYMCTEAGITPNYECKCKDGEYFNLETGICVTGSCPRESVVCTEPNQGGPGISLDHSVNFCYVCNSNLDAIVFRCIGSGSPTNSGPTARFDLCRSYTGPPLDNSTLPTTIPPETTSTPPETTPTTPETTPTPPETTPTPPETTQTPLETTPTPPETTPTPPVTTPPPSSTTIPPEIVCRAVGQRLPDSADCKSYYQCDATLTPQHFTCTGHYDPARLGCVSGGC